MEGADGPRRQPGGWAETRSQEASSENGRKGCSLGGLFLAYWSAEDQRLAGNTHITSSSLDLRVSA